MAKGFRSMTELMDVYSRKIFGWENSSSMKKQWVLPVFKEDIERHGRPEIEPP